MRSSATSGFVASASGPYTTACGFSVTVVIIGIMSMVTQPLSSSAATSPLPATSSRLLKPCVHEPTEQFA